MLQLLQGILLMQLWKKLECRLCVLYKDNDDDDGLFVVFGAVLNELRQNGNMTCFHDFGST
jgi:hypothetical protein